MKKLTQMLALVGVAALCLSTGTVFAQDNGGPGGGPGGDQGGPGGGRGNRGQGGGRGGFGDPAQMRQFMADRTKQAFGSTDEEWKAIEPLVNKVNELRFDPLISGRGGRGGRGGQGGQGGPGGAQASEEVTALADAVEKDASKEDLKAKMAAYRKVRAEKEAELKKAQDELKKVLTTKQEAIALQMSLVN